MMAFTSWLPSMGQASID